MQAIKKLHGTPLDKKHTMLVNKLTDIDRFGREGRIDEEYHPPHIEPFQQTEHLRSWLGDSDGRDQMAMYRGDKVGVVWNEKEDVPEVVVDRDNWTESFVQWSPMGTYLTSMHAQGVQLWGGKAWSRQKRFSHPGVNLVDFSPKENYFTTWSHRPLQIEESRPVPGLSLEEDGKNFIIWDVETGKPLRSFVTIEPPAETDKEGQPIKKKMQWPTFKWSADELFVARMTPRQSISVYELPKMNLLDKSTIKVEGVMDFEWAPASPRREGVSSYEQLLCYWTPELGSNPAKVALVSIPSKEVVRSRNLFSLSDAKLHWQSEGTYLCVKVDRLKTKKSYATNLEIFRVREKGVPVEVIDTLKERVVNFAWEPKGNRFVLITTPGEQTPPNQPPPKTSVSFFSPEKTKGGLVGSFRHVQTLDKRNSNALYWSPRGRFVIIASLQSQSTFDLDFWDVNFEKPKDKDKDDKDDKDNKELAASLQLMTTVEHYGITDIEWDPSGRYVATVASNFRHNVSIPKPCAENLQLNAALLRNPNRWRTATTCTTSAASCCARSTLSASSSCSGARGRPRSCPRRSRQTCARTCATTRASSTSRTRPRRTRPTARWSSSAAACSPSGSRGARASPPCSATLASPPPTATPPLPRTPTPTPTPMPMPTPTSKRSKKSSRKSSTRRRRSLGDAVARLVTVRLHKDGGAAKGRLVLSSTSVIVTRGGLKPLLAGENVHFRAPPLIDVIYGGHHDPMQRKVVG